MKRRTRVRVARVDTKCGSIGYMTVDMIKERIFGEDVDGTCPECGEIHLTPEDVEEAEAKKISNSARYLQIKMEAEAGKRG